MAVCARAPLACAGQPFVWDDDGDGIDDRMEQVHLLGYQFAFEGSDSLGRQRFEVARSGNDLAFGVYVLFKTTPTPADLAAITALGMPVLHRFESIPALRSVATFAQAQAVKLLLNVERIEVVPLLYPELRQSLASIGALDPSGQVFPTWSGVAGGVGHGVVVAILDTGINDSAFGTYPGHESLAGRRVGGAEFTRGDSALDTPLDASVNPEDHGGPLTHTHGTHVAGIVLGDGGASGFAMSLAREARFVDVKVLDDAGKGTGVAEALDWCIHNRDRDWGAGPDAHGIQVINLSLSSLDESDGNDVPSRLAGRAVALGIVVVASTGNEGVDHHIPSPAGADGVLAIGAYDTQRTPRAADDVFALFSDRGPRASDGDTDVADEQKPDLVAPGVAVLSADGDLTSDGTHYQRLSGTSMSAAVVSSAIAALRSEFPALSPAEITSLLRRTARRGIAGVPAGPAGADPRWQAAIGWGALDLYAARLELLQPTRSQVRRLVLEPNTTAIHAEIWTQRERGAAFFVLERAADAGGTPETFVPIDSVVAAGDSSLATTDQRTYSFTLAVPPEEFGLPFWYRVAYSEGGTRFDTPSRRLVGPLGDPIATIHVRIVHDAYDHDVDAMVIVGGGLAALRVGSGAGSESALVFPLPGTSASDSSSWASGESTTGTVAWDFSIPIPAGAAGAFLPPSSAAPWALEVGEAGYPNRSGRIEEFRIVWHAPSGDQTFDGAPLPRPTIEGQTSVVTIPFGITGVAHPPQAAFRSGPNPVFAGNSVRLSVAGANPGSARVFDIEGRLLAELPFAPGGDHWEARWDTAIGGHAVRAGLYFARAGASTARIVVLCR